MSVPVRTTPSETQRAREQMPDEAKRALDDRKQLHLVAAKISEMNWGKGLSNEMQRAVAMYCRQNLIDPTEIDVLGGNIYRNSRYYLRRLSEMTEDGLVEYAIPDHVHADKRLVELAKGADERAEKARKELARREDIRIQMNIPDAAVAAVVFRVKLKNTPVEFAAAKWTGGGTRKSDPVGDTFPVETAETRACRRVMRYIASQVPHLKWREEELDDKGVLVSARLADEREAARIQREVIPTSNKAFDSGAVRPMPFIGSDPYESPGMKPILGPGDTIPTTVVEKSLEMAPVVPVDTSDIETPAPAKPIDDDLAFDQQLVEEEKKGAPPGSLSHRVPKGGAVQDALGLNDQPKRGRDALREG